MEHSGRRGETNKQPPNVLLLNLFILTAHGPEGSEQLQSSRNSGGEGGGSFGVTAFPPKLCGVYEKKISPEGNQGIAKGSLKQLHSTMKVRQMVIHHLLSVGLSFPVYRVG